MISLTYVSSATTFLTPDELLGLIILLDQPIETRQFPSWSMAFTNLDTVTPASVPGYSEFLNLSLTEPSFQQNPTRAQKLRKTFRNRL